MAKPEKRKLINKRRSRKLTTNTLIEPRSIGEFFAMSDQQQDLWKNTVQAVTEMRAGASLRRASRKFGLYPRKVSQLAGPELRKLRNGRWAARSYDHLLRVLVIPTPKGLREIGTRDSRQASKAGKYSAAVQRYLQTGDDSALAQFRGKHIVDATGKRVQLLTDLDELDRLGSAGVLSFESLYARSL